MIVTNTAAVEHISAALTPDAHLVCHPQDDGTYRLEVASGFEIALAAAAAAGPGAHLRAYAKRVRERTISAGCTVMVGGTPVQAWADSATRADLNALVTAVGLGLITGTPWRGRDGTFTALDAAGITALASGVFAFVQAAFSQEAAVLADIESGTITTSAEIDAAAWPSNS